MDWTLQRLQRLQPAFCSMKTKNLSSLVMKLKEIISGCEDEARKSYFFENFKMALYGKVSKNH